MAKTRYRAIFKVYCSSCSTNIATGQRIDFKCANCEYIKYNNVQDLLSFTSMLHTKYPNWVYFNLYEYIKGENGRKLGSFVKGKNEPMGKTL